ncbi:MAG TPA: hypothetical protein HPP81_11830 [Deltaproteobacteria bacterium]|nr:hypothetical protein [Deltaproteobacteria bacterium]
MFNWIPAAAPNRSGAGITRHSKTNERNLCASAVQISAVVVRAGFDNYYTDGAEALSYGEAVRIISSVSGRTVTYHPISEKEMIQGALEQGMPESAIRYISQLFTLVRKGLMAEITDSVRELTGKAPISFKEFAMIFSPRRRSAAG